MLGILYMGSCNLLAATDRIKTEESYIAEIEQLKQEIERKKIWKFQKKTARSLN